MSQNYLYRYIKICKSTINKLYTVVLSLFVCSQVYGCVILDSIAFIFDVFWGGSVNICTYLQVILLFSCVELLYAVDLLTGPCVCSMCMKTELFRKVKIKFLDIVGVINWLKTNHFHSLIRLINNAVTFTHDKVYNIFFTIKQHEGTHIHWNKKKVWFSISDDSWKISGM